MADSRIRPETSSAKKKKNGYTRVKNADLGRRNVTRAVDMSSPSARRQSASVSLGFVPTTGKSELPAVSGEATLHTITSPKHESFPWSIFVLALVCAALFAYMVYNYVIINEHTSVLSDLRSEIATLAVEKNDLSTKLDQKNDMSYIEEVAVQDLGMVSIDEIVKKYIELDFNDVIIKPTK